MLIRKMFRDVLKNKVPFIAVFLMMFAGNFIFSGITSEYNGMRETFHSYIDETNLADAWITGINVQISDMERLEKESNISHVEKRAFLPAALSGNTDKTLDLFILDKKQEISKINIVKGKTYSAKTNGVWLDASFAQKNNYKLHDNIKLTVNGQSIEKEIVGLCTSPEYIYHTETGELVPNHKNNGFLFTNERTMSGLAAISWNQLLVSGNGNLEKTIHTALDTKNVTIVLSEPPA